MNELSHKNADKSYSPCFLLELTTVILMETKKNVLAQCVRSQLTFETTSCHIDNTVPHSSSISFTTYAVEMSNSVNTEKYVNIVDEVRTCFEYVFVRRTENL